MKRLDIYISVLAESYCVSREIATEQLETFIRKNARWRRYFLTEVAFDEAKTLTTNLAERKVGLLGWLMVCGAVSPPFLEVVHRKQEQFQAA